MEAETHIIKKILKNFRKSSNHLNEFFYSDSEIINLAGTKYLITVDNYSGEDYFRTDNPVNLGKNLAACTLSDIFACGGSPVFYCNSISCDKSWNSDYIDNVAKGIAEILEICQTDFIGGDFGYSERWNYTGIAIGKSENIVTRKGAKSGDRIYITGEIGRGNFEAASQFRSLTSNIDKIFSDNPILFPVRLKESELVSKYASSCIDSSDGLFRSLCILSEINQLGFIISDVPYFAPAIELIHSLGIMKEILILGECGEYELVFTVSPELEDNLLTEAESNGCKLFKIGTITSIKDQILITNSKQINLNDYRISAREFTDHLQYIKIMKEYLKQKEVF